MPCEKDQGRVGSLSLPTSEKPVVCVLGSVSVATAEGVVVIGSRLERMLLAALAVSANHVVSSDQLAGILWGDNPPPSRDNTLQTYVSRLRHLIGHDRIRCEDHSYELMVEIDELDALLFEALVNEASVARADPERCLKLCKEALAYWRGVPFGDLSDDDPFRLEAIRLDELRLFAMELRLESEMALGREELIVGALEAMVDEYPYRERLWYLLVAALSMCGRRVEALRACGDLRSVLSEVGLEPTAEMRQLEEDVFTERDNVRPRLHYVVAEQS